MFVGLRITIEVFVMDKLTTGVVVGNGVGVIVEAVKDVPTGMGMEVSVENSAPGVRK